MAMNDKSSIQSLCQAITARARAGGADAVEVVYRESAHLSAKVRLGAPELLEEAGSRALGLRVFRGQRVAVAQSSDLSEAGQGRLVADALELLTCAEEDPYAGAPPAEWLETNPDPSALELDDASLSTMDGATCIAHAIEAESGALKLDKRVDNSDGATFTRVRGLSALATSQGFFGLSQGSQASVAVSPVISDEGGKKRAGSHWDASRFFGDLAPMASVGAEAARRTLAKLGARRVPTQTAPVIFDPEAARSLLSLLASCVNGSSIWRKSSYLVDRIGTQVASPLVTIVDDPFVRRGPGSRAWDGEGVPSVRNVVVEAGKLATYLTDSYAARRLGHAKSTANASRGGASVGVGVTNFRLEPGQGTLDDLVAATPKGLLVTDMMGFGFNAVTGDFSRGASGFWIENGAIAYPVSEVTVSLNLDALLKSIDAVAGDLDTRSSLMSPSFRVPAMTIAGGE